MVFIRKQDFRRNDKSYNIWAVVFRDNLEGIIYYPERVAA